VKAARTLIEGERFLHKDLWRVVERQLEHAAGTPRGSFYDDLVAMVFALHALEAYLNFVGGRLAPDIWTNEREYFKREPYRGFEGKVRKVLELAALPEPGRDARPYSTVWFLKDLRDLIAHAKPFTFNSIVEHTVDVEPPLNRTSFDALVSRENAERARDDIKAFAEAIHAAARPKVNDLWFGEAPFGGTIQYSSGHTTLAT
jgi:hypothetical protein